MKDRFIKNKRPLNLAHISFKKEKQPKTKTTRRTILMSQSNDDEERETLLKRQRRQKDIVMKGNVNPQQAT
jgi:hypothetical protein